MELKVGMYVRFKDNKDIQYIGKLININEHREPCFKYTIEVTWCDDYIFIGDNDIIGEPSFDLTGLIKVGDYVNGEKVTETMIKMRDEQGVFGLPDHYRMFVDEIHIKSVVTREQFEDIKFEVVKDE